MFFLKFFVWFIALADFHMLNPSQHLWDEANFIMEHDILIGSLILAAWILMSIFALMVMNNWSL